MLCRSSSVAQFESVSLLRDVITPHILPCLADLSTVVFGRGRTTARVPMVQVNMLLLLRKHLLELSADLVETVLGGSATEGVTLCVAAQSVVQVRDAAYDLLLALWHLRLSPDSSAVIATGPFGEEWATEGRLLALRRRVCQLLLNGLRDRDTAGMNADSAAEVPSAVVDAKALTDISKSRYDSAKAWRDDASDRVGVRRKVFSFFEASLQQQGYGLSGDMQGRLHALMNELYDASQPQQWLQYASFLTLSVTRRTARYSAPLFQHSLSDASSYTPLPVAQRRGDASGRGGRLSAMTPMFSLERTSQVIADQLASQSQSGGAGFTPSSLNIAVSQGYLASQGGTQSEDAYSQRRGGMIRGTQQLSWTQTQLGPGEGGPRTTAQAVGAPGAGERLRAGAFVDTSSTQFLGIGMGGSLATLPVTQRTASASVSADGAGAAAASSQAMGPPVGLPSRYVTTQRVPIRFSRKMKGAEESAGADAAGSSLVSRAAKYAAVAAVQAGGKMARDLKEQERRSGGKGRVVVYRTYRQGELPDIAISLSDLLQPLQSLCLLDDAAAGLVFGDLHDALYKQHLEQSAAEAVNTMCGDLRAMLQASRGAGVVSGSLCATLLRRSSHALRSHLAASREAQEAPAAGGRQKGRSTASSGAARAAPVFPAELLLPAELVAECAVQSNSFHSGIHVLEEQLVLLKQTHGAAAATLLARAGDEDAVSATQQALPKAGRKRNIQATAEEDSDGDAVSVASSIVSSSKRARLVTGSTAGIASKRAGRSSKSASASAAPRSEPTADEPTQQSDALTADELLDQMSGSVSAGRGGGGRRAAAPPAVAAASADVSLTPAQKVRLHRQERRIWHQLYRLYDKLGEKDVLLGLTAKLGEEAEEDSGAAGAAGGGDADSPLSHSELSRRALDAELSGDFEEAVRIYSSLNEQVDQQLQEGGAQADAAVDQAQRDLWDERSLQCLKQLCDWKQLYECVDKVARLSLADTVRAGRGLWEVMSSLGGGSPQEGRLKEYLLPHYLQSLLHLSCPYTPAAETAGPMQERDSFVGRVLSYQPAHLAGGSNPGQATNLFDLRQYVENRFPVELATCAASAGQWARARKHCEQANQRFVARWSAVHPCATQARRQLLSELQLVVELTDAGEFYSASATGQGGRRGTSGSSASIKSVLAKWEVAQPALTDEIPHWADVACGRHFSLHSALTQAQAQGQGHVDTAAGDSESLPPPAAAQMQLASLHVQTAAAAVHQGVLSAVKTQLNINNAIRKSGKPAPLYIFYSFYILTSCPLTNQCSARRPS
jgi:hypothetical protein